MTETDLLQPDPGPLRAAAGAAGLAQPASGLGSIDGRRLEDSNPMAPLARDMTETGLIVRHCARHDPLYRLGGVLRAFRYLVTPLGSGGAWLVTGRQGTEAGR